jgi:hypothetical protein
LRSTLPRPPALIALLLLFAATQVALSLIGRASLLPSFMPFGEAPYNVKWWLSLSVLMDRDGALDVWSPYPPVFPWVHLAWLRTSGLDADALQRHFFEADPSVSAVAAPMVAQTALFWTCWNAALLLGQGSCIAWLVARVRGRAAGLFAAGAYLLMTQSYASRILSGVVSDQFDYLPSLLMLLGLVFVVRGSLVTAAIATAVGTMTKVFPVLLLPVLWFRATNTRVRVQIVAVFAAMTALIAAPFALSPQAPLLSFVRFTLDRSGWESVWTWPQRALPPWPSSEQMATLFTQPYVSTGAGAGGGLLMLATLAAFAWLAYAARHRVADDTVSVRVVLLFVLALLFFSRGFSSYFVFWIFPLLFVVEAPIVAAAWTAALLIVGNLEFVGDARSWPMYWPSIFARQLLLALLALSQVRRLVESPPAAIDGAATVEADA